MASSGWPAGVARAHTHVPVVVEADAFSSVVGKARLLEANTPKRTVSPMDEARVVHSLVTDDHLSPTQITKLLGRGRGWVDRRVTLGQRLAPECARHLDAGRLSATTAHALAGLPAAEQPRLAESIVRHGLRTREAEALLATWRAASDTPTREALLRDPRRATPAPGAPAVSPLGPTARELQTRFLQTEHALQELTQLDLTGFPDPDHRVLAACQRRLVARILQLAHTLQKEHATDADPRGTGRTAAPGAGPHPDPRHGPAPEPRRQDHPPSPGPLARAPRRPRPRSWRPTTR